jgi:hypothetical protein
VPHKYYKKIDFPTGVVEPHHFDVAPVTPAPALLYTKPTFLKQTKSVAEQHNF